MAAGEPLVGDRRPLEIDVVAESDDGRALLVGEAKWGARIDVGRTLAALRDKARRFPLAGERTIVTALWVGRRPAGRPGAAVVTARDLIRALR